jgi:hypothetical protein
MGAVSDDGSICNWRLDEDEDACCLLLIEDENSYANDDFVSGDLL